MRPMVKRHPVRRPDAARRGTLLIEAIVGAILLGAAISMLVPMMTAVRHQRQSLRFESLAMLELNNIDESLPAVVDASNMPTLSDWFQKRYTTARLDAELLTRSADDVAGSLQAIRLTIHRPLFEAAPEQQVTLVIWRRAAEAAP